MSLCASECLTAFFKCYRSCFWSLFKDPHCIRTIYILVFSRRALLIGYSAGVLLMLLPEEYRFSVAQLYRCQQSAVCITRMVLLYFIAFNFWSILFFYRSFSQVYVHCVFYIPIQPMVATINQPNRDYKSTRRHFALGACCHSNKTSAIANPLNSA